MKYLVIILCLALITFGCKKTSEAPYQSQGTLIGYDTRMCPMCGGLEITIKNDTTKNAPASYLIDSPLPNLNLGSNPKFPINVSLNWTHAPAPLGAYRYIIVSEIKVIK
jgi:hypothetical protein